MLNKAQITHFSKQAAELARQEVGKGGLPFSSIIVDKYGDCIGQGVNQVNELYDCTAHAEIQAIRSACEMLGRPVLADSILFASGEPCGLCYLAIRLAKISQVVILLDRNEVKQLGFDYLWTYQPQHEMTPSVKVDNLSNDVKIGPFLCCQQGGCKTNCVTARFKYEELAASQTQS